MNKTGSSGVGNSDSIFSAIASTDERERSEASTNAASSRSTVVRDSLQISRTAFRAKWHQTCSPVMEIVNPKQEAATCASAGFLTDRGTMLRHIQTKLQCAQWWRKEQARAIRRGDAITAAHAEKCAQRFEAYRAGQRGREDRGLDSVTVGVTIESATLTPEQINQRVGIACDQAHRIGDSSVNTGEKRDRNVWRILEKKQGGADALAQDLLPACVAALLDRLRPISGKLREISLAEGAELFIHVTTRSVPGLYLPPDVIRALADAELSLDVAVDLYSPGDAYKFEQHPLRDPEIHSTSGGRGFQPRKPQ
jgi:hypothetical protein